VTNAICHIAMVLPDMRPGGAERNAVMMVREFLGMGVSVDLVLMKKQGALLEALPDAVRVVDLKAPRTRHVPKRFAAYLRDTKPDAVLVNMWPLTVMCLLARMLSRVSSIIATIDHNTLSKSYADRGRLHRWMLRLSMRMVYPLADARIVVSHGVAEDLAMLSGLSVHAFEVVHNPVREVPPVDEAVKAQVESQWSDSGAARILAVGSMKAQKNFALLIRAFARLAKKQHATLMILGDGELRPQLEAMIEEEQVTDHVRMPGFVADPMPYYQSADLFVLSSDYEGFGNVIVEALACGTSVVSTDCPSGPSEILEDGRYGRLVPVGDAQAMAAAMEDVLKNPFDTDQLKARANMFSSDKNARHYLRVLTQKRVDDD